MKRHTKKQAKPAADPLADLTPDLREDMMRIQEKRLNPFHGCDRGVPRFCHVNEALTFYSKTVESLRAAWEAPPPKRHPWWKYRRIYALVYQLCKTVDRMPELLAPRQGEVGMEHLDRCICRYCDLLANTGLSAPRVRDLDEALSNCAVLVRVLTDASVSGRPEPDPWAKSVRAHGAAQLALRYLEEFSRHLDMAQQPLRY